MGMCDMCGQYADIQTTKQLRSILRISLVLMLISITVEAGGSRGYHLMGSLSSKPEKQNNSGKRVVSTATNSPIYYINKLDLSSLFFNLLPPNSQAKPQLNNLTSFLSDLNRLSGPKKPSKPSGPGKQSTQYPFKRIPLPFVSNAKPVGSYKLKPTQPPVTIQSPSWSTTTSSVLGYTPSKIIRLKTKFLANGQPSAVYVFKSPQRRYSLQDILRRRGFPVQDKKTMAKKRPNYKNKGRVPFW